jgi:hypothetical protein
LKACSVAAKQRNSLVHSIVVGGGLDVVLAVKGARRSHKVTVTQWSLGEIRGVVDKLIRAEHGVAAAVEGAFGDEWRPDGRLAAAGGARTVAVRPAPAFAEALDQVTWPDDDGAGWRCADAGRSGAPG